MTAIEFRTQSPLKKCAAFAFLPDKAQAQFEYEKWQQYEIDIDIEERAAMTGRAIVWHHMLNQILANIKLHTVQTTTSFREAIKQCEKNDLVTRKEGRWLKYFNQCANQAKHGSPHPSKTIGTVFTVESNSCYIRATAAAFQIPSSPKNCVLFSFLPDEAQAQFEHEKWQQYEIDINIEEQATMTG